jgi:hypothetical protein
LLLPLLLPLMLPLLLPAPSSVYCLLYLPLLHVLPLVVMLPPPPELGHLSAAKEAFHEVLHAISRTKGFVQLPEAYVNLGHLGLARRHYTDALRMYELASRLNQQRDVKVGGGWGCGQGGDVLC